MAWVNELMAVLTAILFSVLMQAPQRDALRVEAQLGAVSGRVIDADTGAPLRNARVGLVPEQGDEPDPVLTDADGRFRIATLPSGRYTLVASKPGYVSLRYGARRAVDPPQAIDVSADTPPIEVRVPRGAALSGRLVDDLGDPIPAVRVTAGVIVRTAAGARMTPVRSGDTDDRGEYRIAGLPEGTYVVSARPGPTAPDGMTFVGMDTAAGAPTYERLYHPSTPALSQARQIPLRPGEDVANIDLTFRPVRRPQLTIEVRDATGAAAAAFIDLVSDEAVSALARQVQINAGGSATLAIDPGDWIVLASGRPGRAVVPLTIREADAAISVMLTPGTTIAGHVVYEGSRKPAALLRLTERSALPPLPMFRSLDSVPIAPDGTFTISGVRDPRQLQIDGLPSGWRLKGIFLDGVDVTTIPPQPAAQMTGVTVVLTAARSEVSGTVVDEHGSKVQSADVLIYPRDASLLVNAARWARWVRTDQHGAFVARDLPAGSYLAVALSQVDATRWTTREYLDGLRRQAVAFTLGDGDRRMIAVALAAGGQQP